MFFMTILAVLGPFNPPYPSSQTADQSVRDLAPWLRQRLTDIKVVGGNFTLVRTKGEPTIVHFGIQDSATRKPVSNATIFDWGSITKVFTGMAILQLRAQGRLNLSDRVANTVPEVLRLENVHGNTAAITLKQLMSHTSGLQRGSFPISVSWAQRWPDWPQVAATLPWMKVEHQPGSRYAYSNLGVLLLGQVIEVVTQDGYESYMDKNLLRPLGMRSSYFDWTPNYLKPFKSMSYYYDEEGQRQAFPADANHGVTTSNGGLKTSIADMITFARFLLSASPATTPEILKRPSLEEMLQVQAPLPEQENQWICLSFFKRQVNGVDFYSHGGSANGFLSEMAWAPEHNAVFFISINTYARGYGVLRDDLYQRMARLLAASTD